MKRFIIVALLFITSFFVFTATKNLTWAGATFSAMTFYLWVKEEYSE